MNESTESAGSVRLGREIRLPAKVVVSMRAGAMLAAANVLCVIILAWAWMHVKGEAKVISVTGSAMQVIQSDLIVWEGKIFVNSPDLQQGYAAFKAASERTVEYLKSQHIGAEQMNTSAVWINKNFARDEKGNTT